MHRLHRRRALSRFAKRRCGDFAEPAEGQDIVVRPNHALSASASILAHVLAAACILTHGAAPACAAEAGPARTWDDERNAAVLLARQGDAGAALAILERLRQNHPGDLGVARDQIVVAVWAGRDAEAIELFAALPRVEHPDYVVEAVARGHRSLGRFAEALALYRQGLQQSPDSSAFAGGEIRSIADLGEAARALTVADADLRSRGERLDVLLAAGYAATAQRKPVEALRYIDRAVKLDPRGREAAHDRIVAIAEMGAPQVALKLADENPGVLSAAERRRIEGDAAAALVRWGVFEPPSEAQRFAATDRAIGELDGQIRRWAQVGDAARSDVLRARFDRMVALRDRVRMADVLAEYDDLVNSGVPIPGYALVAAADAHLYLRRPEAARDLYLRALESDPRNPETQLALFYAYVDLNDFGEAYRIIDDMTAEQPVWLYLKGLNDPVENPYRAAADLAAANARLFADELAAADRLVAALAETAPNNTRHLIARANVYAARGWPRLAAEEFEIILALTPRNVSGEVGRTRNDMLLREYSKVEAPLADLKLRFPENREVQRLERLWRVHNMAELRVNAERAVRSATNIQGGSGIAVEAQLHSAPLGRNWRAFATSYFAREELVEGDGSLRRTGLGAEYRGRDLIASLEGTISAYGPDDEAPLTSALTEGRGGVRMAATWSIDDHWQIGGDAEALARDTPLRALRNGVTANAASASVAYRESESRTFRLSGGGMDFSDGNFRTTLASEYSHRLLTRPQLAADGLIGLAGSWNSKDADRAYYNPRQDALASVGLSVAQTIHRSYEFSHDHRLVVTPGVYWEQNFGSGGAASVLYEHRIQNDDVLEASLGVSVGRQPYDGIYENSLVVLLGMRVRF